MIIRQAMLTALLACATRPAAAFDSSESADCYDAAVVGQVVKVRDFVDLNDILPREPETLYLGGRMKALVRTRAVLAGTSPRSQWVEVTLTSMPTPKATLLFILKNRQGDVPTVAYVQMFSPKATKREWEASLKSAPVKACLR